MEIDDWNGRRIMVGLSRRGVKAVCDFSDNLIRPAGSVWPPAPILQKLYRSPHGSSFDGENASLVARTLGYYCDLQSLHSEDAITWSFFGPLSGASDGTRLQLLHWFGGRIGITTTDTRCEICLFRRIPHPDTLVPGGPEIDFMLQGDRTVILGECKWRSAIGSRQGKKKNKDQIQLRGEFLARFRTCLFPSQQLAVVLLVREGAAAPQPATGDVHFRPLRWAELLEYSDHPQAAEFARYLRWKEQHTR